MRNYTYSETTPGGEFRNEETNLSSLAKWLSVCLRTKWLWVRIQLQSLKIDLACLKLDENEI